MLQGFKQSLDARCNFVLAALANKWFIMSFLELSTLVDGRDEVINHFQGSVAQVLSFPVCEERKLPN